MIQMSGAMGAIVDHIESCPFTGLGVIGYEIERRGKNQSKVPIAISYELCSDSTPEDPHHCWHVYVEVNMRSGTFEIEAEDRDLYRAVNKALGSIRREMSKATNAA